MPINDPPEYTQQQGYYGNQPPQQPSYPPTQPYVPSAPQFQGPPKKKGMSTTAKVVLGVIIGSFLLCGGGLAACTGLFAISANEVSKQQAAKASHVQITGCNVQSANAGLLPNVKVDLTVNNASKNQETYFIDVFVFNSSDERVGNSIAIVSDVRPGQVAKHTEMVLLTKAVSGTIKCKVDKVS